MHTKKSISDIYNQKTVSIDPWQLDAEVNHKLAQSYNYKNKSLSFAKRISLYTAHKPNQNRHLAADASDQTKFNASIRPSKY